MFRRQFARVAKASFTCYVHPEIEFYLVSRDAGGRIHPTDDAGYFDRASGNTAHDFRRHVILMLEQMEISIQFSHRGGGLGRSEIDLRLADALSMADNIVIFRTVVEEVALEGGYLATFMPKPFPNEFGSSMYTHFSLLEGNHNAFFGPAGQCQLSAIGRSFIAGLLHYASEIAIITNQHVNSCKRLWGGGGAPGYVCWGHNNRSALVRVPMHKPDKAQSTQVEFRGIDSSANPYLAYAVIPAVSLKGIEEGYELPPEARDDVWALSETEHGALGIHILPTLLKSVVATMERSDLVADTFGEDTFGFFLRDEHREYRAYDAQIIDFEISQFFSYARAEQETAVRDHNGKRAPIGSPSRHGSLPRTLLPRAGFHSAAHAGKLLGDPALLPFLPDGTRDDNVGKVNNHGGRGSAGRSTWLGDQPAEIRLGPERKELIDSPALTAGPGVALLSLVRLAETAITAESAHRASVGGVETGGTTTPVALLCSVMSDPAAGPREHRYRLLVVLGASQALDDFPVTHPERLTALAPDRVWGAP